MIVDLSRASARRACVAAVIAAFLGTAIAVVPATPAGALVAPPGFQVANVITGLNAPMNVEFADDGRVFVAEKAGIIKVYDSLADTTPTTYADLRTKVMNDSDRGLLGFALHPNYPTDPRVFVQYSHDAAIGGTAPRWNDSCTLSNGCVISGRLSVLSGAGSTAGPEQVLVEDWCQQFDSHSIGTIAFGPDGFLYAGAGDGASYNYADHGQTGNPCGDPPGAAGTNLAPPTAEGGALRSLDARTPADPQTLDGTIIRIDPATGQGVAGNPFFATPGADDNEKRIVADGLRNPYRWTFRPGTSEIWIGDVGWTRWEEINRLQNPADGVLDRFGWPCYEGAGRQSGYDNQNLNMCETFYSEGATAKIDPVYAWDHGQKVVAGESCPTGSSSVAGLAFYDSAGNYPTDYDGALFFADYSRNCIWAMKSDASGVPQASQRSTFIADAGGPVELQLGPDGNLYYVAVNEGAIKRVTYQGANEAPTAVITSDVTSGSAPLTVQLSGASSTDPDPGDLLTYAWDLDNDGAYDDATGPTASRTFTTPGAYPVRLRVTDDDNASDTESLTITVDANAPTASITTPTVGTTWAVGDPISFSGTATDPQQGTLPASALTWDVILHHCPSNCHTHFQGSYEGVASGVITAPDHEYPSYLEIKMTATDSTGLTDTVSVDVNPRGVPLTLTTTPTGLTVSTFAESGPSPLTRTVIEGSNNSISAPSPQTRADGRKFAFNSWSDGGAATHNVVVNQPTTLTATYQDVTPPVPPNLVAAYDFDAGAGASLTDITGKGHTGSIVNAAWSATGRYGGALSFDGTSSRVDIASAADLKLGAAMTLEAWVRPIDNAGWRTVMLKERGGNGLSYALYGSDGLRANSYVSVGGTDQAVNGTGLLPLNTWSHLASTYDGANLRLFVNGTQVATRALSGIPASDDQPLRIGGNLIWDEWFAGLIDEVRIYDRALTQTQIQADLAGPLVGDDQAPTAPGGLTATGGESSVAVSWTASTDNVGVAAYRVHRSTTSGFTPDAGNLVQTVTSGTSWSDTGRTPGTYHYKVIAVDAANNVSAASTQASATVTGDATNPTVSVTAPTAAAQVTGIVNLTANATDAGGVASVQFKVDGANVGPADTTAPYSFSWDSNAVSTGSHTIAAVATDNAGNTGTSTGVTVTVVRDETGPTVAITAPAQGASVTGTITVTANATDPSGVTSVQFRVDGVAIGTDTTAPYTVSWNTGTVTPGAHVLTVVATDTLTNATTSAAVNVTVTVDTTGPTVSLTAPAAGANVSGAVNLNANATDTSGVASVHFRVDGVNVGAADTTAPYSVSWNTTGVALGAHQVTAVATDTLGNVSTSAAVSVNVVASTGLVAAYNFNAGTGTTAADSSGNNHTGTLNNAAWTAAGRNGGALSFNGTNAKVDVTSTTALRFGSTMTLEAWVRPANVSDWRTVIMKEHSAGLAYALYASDGASSAGYVRIGTADRAVNGTGQLALNTWSHLAMTYDGANMRLYVNGTQVASRAQTGTPVSDTGALRIGGNAVWAEWFNGQIDDVRVYNRALTPPEIATDRDTPVS